MICRPDGSKSRAMRFDNFWGYLKIGMQGHE